MKRILYLKLIFFVLFEIFALTVSTQGNKANFVEPFEDDPNYEYEGSGGYDDKEYNDYNEEGTEDDGFKCVNGMRLAKSKVCNGIRDCDDCSDEENCSISSSNIFFCYEKGDITGNNDINGPRCIATKYFCDGAIDCPNGADELQSGPGFKCQVKDRFRKCVLPDRMVCDGIANCEDKSDVCNAVETSTLSNRTSSTEARYSKTPIGFFRCLRSELLISQNQLCDGEFDCSDLSDECLCEIEKSQIVHDVCNAMCTRKLWKNQKENDNCLRCNLGEIYWQKQQNQEKECFSPPEILSFLKNDQRERINLINETSDYDVITCFDQLIIGMIRARKCDGRPECLFGEDECNAGCTNGGDHEYFGSGQPEFDPKFCQLLTSHDSGYHCLSDLYANKTLKNSFPSRNENNMRTSRIIVCDGNTECDDGSDEAFCPTRLSCSPEINETAVETYDIAQQCDGFSQCYSGEDERPEICVNYSNSNILPCGEKDGRTKYFRSKNLLDGKSDCPTSADECPPFLTKIDKVKAKYYEGMSEKQILKTQQSISTHDRAIDDLPLQVFLIAAALIGLSALVVSVVLAFYNLNVACMTSGNEDINILDVWLHNGVLCIREITNLSITIAKGFVCGYFAYIKIIRTEDANYSLVDLRWRSSTSCSVAGSLVLIGTQVPIFSLASFAGGYLLLRACRKRKQCSYTVSRREENGRFDAGDVLDPGKKINAKLLLFFSCFILIVISWLPVGILAALLTFPSALNARTRTYAWVRASSAPSLFRANLLDRDTAEKFASTLVTIKNHSYHNVFQAGYFTFSEFAKISDSTAPSIGIHMRGSYGYFSQSGACLPSFLTHVSGGVAPFDMAVSNSWTWGISLTILIVDLVLIVATTVMATRYADAAFRCSCCVPRHAQSSKNRSKILNSTFSFLAYVEVLTLLSIISFFFLKAAVPDSLSDFSYVKCCMTVLGLNCGIVSPFLLLRRKFHLRSGKTSVVAKRRPRSLNDSMRIVEENNTDEKGITESKLLNYEKSANMEHAGNEESENLMVKNGTEMQDILKI